MGIARFYRWLSERYPLINERLLAEQLPDFDNLYLDMNGIIHNCSHNNTGGLCVTDDDEVFVSAFKYVVRIVNIIKPKRMLYMAVDGCAPRAKMNQQRSRRFRAANDVREDREKAQEMGEVVPENPFDSNCITPGTEFMARLTESLRFFVQLQMNEDPLWQGITVVLSGPDVPGEGEHKIMDYIRSAKAQPGYASNVRHCLYGGDADLIMLALATHEPHFALLREEVIFGRAQTKTSDQRALSRPNHFQLLHISLLREYIELEFSRDADSVTDIEFASFQFDAERVIDDFVLFCVMVGNDFLPHLPFAEISEGGLASLFQCYKEHLWEAPGEPWLVKDCGDIDFQQLARFLRRYAPVEEERMSRAVADGEFKLGSRRLVGPTDAPDPPNMRARYPEQSQTVEEARTNWYDVKFAMDVNTHEGTQRQRRMFHSYLEGLQWVMLYYFRGPDNASWSWYYPYYHAPMVYDLAGYDLLARPQLQLEAGRPFMPFQQLMAVLPAASKALLPQCYQWLFDSDQSPILAFYPRKFEIDIDGVKVPWGGVACIPFIDPGLLVDAMALADTASLSPPEQKRNLVGTAYVFTFDQACVTRVESPMPHRVSSLVDCHVRSSEFEHPALPAGEPHFPNKLLPGFAPRAPGFPTVHLHPLSHRLQEGVKVFHVESRAPSLVMRLKPELPPQSDRDKAQQLLEAPFVQVGYPFAHHGQIASVLSANAAYTAGGHTAPRNPRDQAEKLAHVRYELRQRGIVVELGKEVGGTGADVELLAEVRVAESRYVDCEGVLHHRFRDATELRLVSLLRPVHVPPAARKPDAPGRIPAGERVICIDVHSPLFGQTGLVNPSPDDGDVRASFAGPLLAGTRQVDLQETIRSLVEASQQRFHWHSLEKVCQIANLDKHSVRQIFGSLRFRGAENVREDIGMCLMSDRANDKAKANAVCYCVPAYSKKSDKGAWLFSDLAVGALRDYASKYPALFNVLRNRTRFFADVEARSVFPDSPDVNYSARKLVKYCNGSPFKQLPLVPPEHAALPPSAVASVLEAVSAAQGEAAASKPPVGVVQGRRHLHHASHRGCRPPAELLARAGDLELGQRGAIAKPHGLVPFGSLGTVVAIYGHGSEQTLEVVTDVDTFGGADLQGRCPAMRGVRVSVEDFMPLMPRPGQGQAGADSGAASKPQRSAKSSIQPPTRVTTEPKGVLTNAPLKVAEGPILPVPPESAPTAAVPLPSQAPSAPPTDRTRGQTLARLASATDGEDGSAHAVAEPKQRTSIGPGWGAGMTFVEKRYREAHRSWQEHTPGADTMSEKEMWSKVFDDLLLLGTRGPR